MIRIQTSRHALSLALLLLFVLPTAAHADWDGAGWADYSSFLSPITAEVKANCRAILADGVSQGRVPGRMGQIGDSITYSFAYFRNVIVVGIDDNETGHDYGPVLSWIAYNGTKPADDQSWFATYGKGNAFGCYSGWEVTSALRLGHPTNAIEVGDGSMAGDFSWAVIMLGTNDVDHSSFDKPKWKGDYRGFIQQAIDLGVVPVLSTIPPEAANMANGHVAACNEAITELASEMLLPIVDYYGLIMHYQPDSWFGTLIKDDGTHPSAGGGGSLFSQQGLTTTDGYAARTKLTLDMAEKIRRIVFENGPAEVITPTQGSSTGRLKAGYR